MKYFSNSQHLRQQVQHKLAQMSSELISSLTSYDFILEALFHEALFYASSERISIKSNLDAFALI